MTYNSSSRLMPSLIHAFGMEMNGRKWQGTANNFRYTYNGKEDDKVSCWLTQDYGFRTYDYRLGRFYSQDPLFSKFPWYSPYQFAGNKVIQAVDLDGAEEDIVIKFYQHTGDQKPEIQKIKYSDLKMEPSIGLDNYRTDAGKLGEGTLYICHFLSLPADAQTIAYYEPATMDYINNLNGYGTGSEGTSNKTIRKTDSKFVDAAELAEIFGSSGPRSNPNTKPSGEGKGAASGEVGEGIGQMNKKTTPGNDGSKMVDYYEDGDKKVGIGIKKNGDSLDAYNYKKSVPGHSEKGEHNYERGEGWSEVVREAQRIENSERKSNPK